MVSESVQDGAVEVNESEQDKSMARLAEILRENGIRQVGCACFSQGFHLTFDGDHNEGSHVLELVQDVAEECGYKVGWLQYEMTYAPDKELRRRHWVMSFSYDR